MKYFASLFVQIISRTIAHIVEELRKKTHLNSLAAERWSGRTEKDINFSSLKRNCKYNIFLNIIETGYYQCHGQSEERTAPEQDNIDASLQGSSTSNPPGIVLFHRNSKTFSKPCQILTSTWAIWAIWQRYYNSLPGRASKKQMSHAKTTTLPDDELPPAKKIRKDSEFCEGSSVSIHANDDNHHSLDGEKKLCQRSHTSGMQDDEDEQDQSDEAS